MRWSDVNGHYVQQLRDFQLWTQENYPEEASEMWVDGFQPRQAFTEESALSYLQLGEEYLRG